MRANHTLIVDELRVDSNKAGNRPGTLPSVRNLQAKAYERHIDLTWDAISSRVSPDTSSIERLTAAPSARSEFRFPASSATPISSAKPAEPLPTRLRPAIRAITSLAYPNPSPLPHTR